MFLFGLAACGRFGFDDRERIEDARLDMQLDTMIDAGVCGRTAVAPPTVHIRGTTFRYTSFDNERVPLSGASIEASTTVNGPAIATASSASDGAYDLAIDTDGAAPEISVRYSLGTDFVTHVVFDLPVDRDIMGANGDVLELGDGPIWDLAAMDQVYSTAGFVRDPADTFINIAVRDCANLPIAGATVAITPAPDAVVYQANDGRPAPGLTETQTRFGQAFGVNAVGTSATITVTHPTRTFVPFTISIVPGTTNMLAVARAID